MAVFGHLLGAIAHSDDALAFRCFGCVLLQALEQLGDVPDAGQVGIEHRVRGIHQMAMGIDEARHQGLALQVELLRIRSGEFHDFGA